MGRSGAAEGQHLRKYLSLCLYPGEHQPCNVLRFQLRSWACVGYEELRTCFVVCWTSRAGRGSLEARGSLCLWCKPFLKSFFGEGGHLSGCHRSRGGGRNLFSFLDVGNGTNTYNLGAFFLKKKKTSVPRVPCIWWLGFSIYQPFSSASFKAKVFNWSKLEAVSVVWSEMNVAGSAAPLTRCSLENCSPCWRVRVLGRRCCRATSGDVTTMGNLGAVPVEWHRPMSFGGEDDHQRSC